MRCHHQLHGHEVEETPQNSEEKGNLFFCHTCNHRVSDMTQQLNNTSEGKGSSEASGRGGSTERFRWKGKLPILWYKSLNPRHGTQDFECVTKYCFLKKQKLFSAEVRPQTEFVLQILLMDVEGIWSGLSLQKPDDQLLNGQHHGRHSALGGKRIQPSHPLSSPSPPTPNPSQHQGLFQ